MHFNALVNSTPVAGNLANDQWLIFDCRFALNDTERGRRDYAAAHIPGAVYAHLDEDLSRPVGPGTGRHPLPDVNKFCDWLGAKGLDNDTQAVVYDDAGGMIAARLWWMLHWVGHDRAALLDGGWQGWQRAGYPVTADVPTRAGKSFTPKPDNGLWVTTAALEDELRRGSCKLVDARAGARFEGREEPLDKIAGHVPGAVNHPLTLSLDDQGYFLPAPQLQRSLAELMHDTEAGRVINMCGSGVTACHNILAMTVAGWPGTRLYPGSWSEWIADPARPVVTSKETGR